MTGREWLSFLVECAIALVVVVFVSVVLASGQNFISWLSVSKLRRRVCVLGWHEHMPSTQRWRLWKVRALAAGVQFRTPKTALSLLSASEVNHA
jgi:hypothetical protein